MGWFVCGQSEIASALHDSRVLAALAELGSLNLLPSQTEEI